jgi:hypothetical protein
MRSALATAALVALLSGCTDTATGQPNPGSGSSTLPTTPATSSSATSTTTSGVLPSDGAPKVEQPVNAGKFPDNPCLVLNAAQTRELNLPAQGAPFEDVFGHACRWRNADTGADAEIRWDTKEGRGLSGWYAANNAGRVKFFEPTQIEGLPAIRFGVTDGRSDGECSAEVGLSDSLSFQVNVQLSLANIGKADPCQAAERVASMMIQTIKAGG